MNDPKPEETARRANASGTEFLTIGLGVGAMGLAGAAIGAVCPLCVVATPALIGVGVAQKLRAFFLSRRAAATPQLGARIHQSPK